MVLSGLVLSREGNERRARAACLCHVGPELWVGSSRASVVAYDARSGKMLRRTQAPGKLDSDVATCMCVVGPYVWVGCSDGRVSVFNGATSALVQRLRATPHGAAAVTCMAASARFVWTGSADCTLVAWDRETGEPRATLRGHENWVRALAPVGPRLWSASDDATIRIWDETVADDPGAGEGIVFGVAEGHTGPVLCLAVCGSYVWSGSADRTIRVWDGQGGRTVAVLSGHEGHVTALACADGLRAVWSASTDKTVRAWDSASHRLLRTLQGHSAPVWSLAAVDGAALLWSGAGDGSLSLWETTEGSAHAATSAGIDLLPRGSPLGAAGPSEGPSALSSTAPGDALAEGHRRTRTTFVVVDAQAGRRAAADTSELTVSSGAASASPPAPAESSPGPADGQECLLPRGGPGASRGIAGAEPAEEQRGALLAPEPLASSRRPVPELRLAEVLRDEDSGESDHGDEKENEDEDDDDEGALLAGRGPDTTERATESAAERLSSQSPSAAGGDEGAQRAGGAGAGEEEEDAVEVEGDLEAMLASSGAWTDTDSKCSTPRPEQPYGRNPSRNVDEDTEDEGSPGGRSPPALDRGPRGAQGARLPGGPAGAAAAAAGSGMSGADDAGAGAGAGARSTRSSDDDVLSDIASIDGTLALEGLVLEESGTADLSLGETGSRSLAGTASSSSAALWALRRPAAPEEREGSPQQQRPVGEARGRLRAAAAYLETLERVMGRLQQRIDQSARSIDDIVSQPEASTAAMRAHRTRC
eukprot:m51a1_g7509 putative wd-40 repeat-containing protein (762) ;mRNA; f:290796-293396